MFVVKRLLASTTLLALACGWLFMPPLSVAHPQCLDFQPPYKDSQISYCVEYEEFGCCWRVTDRRARKRVDFFLPRVSQNQTLINNCRPYLRNISCTFCNPYAAHIYDVEGGQDARAFPWLCRGYCQEAYQHCHQVLLRMFKLEHSDFGVAKNPSSPEQLVTDSQTFCSQVISQESPYCYPDVLQGPSIQGSFTSTPTGDLGCICVKPVTSGLRNPLSALHSGDGTERLFIIEQIGLIRILLANNTLLTQPFLNIESRVLISRSSRGDERGLLGLAFHPNYRDNGKFYVYYSTTISNSHYSKVSEFTVSQSNPNVADPNSERELLRVQQPRSNHNGGQLLFLDGYLLIALGDGGGGGDPFGTTGNGQNKSTLLGSILRIDVDRSNTTQGTSYATPPDNPFVGEADTRPEIYAYGLRNPWRCSVDRGDRETGNGRGRVFCGDVGQNQFEEIDIIEVGGNYGWRAYEGNQCFRRSQCDQLSASGAVLKFPIDAYGRGLGVSVTGGYVYRGCLFPNLRGIYIYGDFGSGRLFALRENVTTATWQRQELCMGESDVCTGDLVGVDRKRHITSFGEDEDGEVYILAVDNATPTTTDGVVYQLVDPSRRESPVKCRGVRN